MAGLYVQKEKNEESPKQVVNKFLRRLKQSAILQQAKESMYRKKPLSWKMKIRSAVRREQMRRYYEKLKKLGKI